MVDDSHDSRYRTFIMLAAVFLAVRVMLLLFWPETYTFLEELYSGVIARVLHDGFLLPPMEYMWHPYEGGTLIFGLSAIPFFKIIGPTHLALKATAVAYSFFTFALWYFLVARFFGRLSALFCGILFCFPPIGLTRLFFLSMGIHPQNALFDILILNAFYRFYFADVGVCAVDSDALSPRRQFSNACLFGFWAGLGIYFCYFSVITLLACLLTWLAVGGKTGGRKCLWGFLSFFIVGSLPLLYYNSIHPLAGLKTIIAIMPGRQWAAPGIAGSLRVFLRMILYDTYWFGTSCYGGFSRCYWFVYSALIVCAVLWIFALKGPILFRSLISLLFFRRRMRYEKSEYMEIPIILYIILFFTIAVATHMERKFGFDVQAGYFVAYRYFTVLFPYVICVMALFLTRLWGSRFSIVRMGALFLVGSIVFFCITSLPLRFSGVTPAIHHKGYRYYLLGWKIAQTDTNPEAIRRGLNLSSRLASAEDRLDFIEGFCEIFWWGAIEVDEIPLKEGSPTAEIDRSIRQNINAIEEKIHDIDSGYAREFYKALGRVLCLRYIYERDYQVERCISLFKETDPGFRGAVFEGMGQVVGSIADVEKRKIELIAPNIPKKYHDAFAKGVSSAAQKPYIQITL